eukprot:TRINITY_DN4738_c0_g1_i11.p1 TRINITY_DN4738_c0_g1~~TRINITY_DN4738_c0_g1_i11.p1  ORF type:complete len:328 (-),score=-0.32 TRINITY_DN4738_c0_g1_i11:106-1089(-)
MSSLVGACLFVVCLHFADVGKAVRRDFQTESVEVEEAVRRDLQTESVEGRETDLAHETLSSVEKTLVSKRGGGKPTKPKPTKPSPRASRDSGKPPNPATTTPSPTPSGNSRALGRRKLNVLALHGAGQSGPEMMHIMGRCGALKSCSSIANFYYPTGPNVVRNLVSTWVLPPKPRGFKRHWYNMGLRFSFSGALFNNARRSIQKFVDKEVRGPVDVICGYSQGAMAATQLLNDIFSGKIQNEKLQKVRAAIFFGTPAPRKWSSPSVSREVGKRVKSLHCHGNRDDLTPLRGARRHARAFKNSTFHVYRGPHEPRSIGNVMRRFLLSL